MCNVASGVGRSKRQRRDYPAIRGGCIMGQQADEAQNIPNSFPQLARRTTAFSSFPPPRLSFLFSIHLPRGKFLSTRPTPHRKTTRNEPPIMDAALVQARSLLQPITHNLPGPIHDAGLSLLGPKCYQKLIKDIDPVNYPECLKLAISKGLGIGIIGASSVVKIPQLIKLLRSQSAEGISFLSYLLETSSYIIGLAYNARNGFPFSTYGETALIAVQNVAIAALVLHFKGRDAGAAAWVAGLAAAGYALFDQGIVDAKTLAALQAAGGVLSIASKAPQIVEVYRQGGTGQLSAFAVSWEHPLSPFFAFFLHMLMLCFCCRSSTTSSAPCRASSPPSRRLMTR